MNSVAVHDRHVIDIPGLEVRTFAAGEAIFEEGKPGNTAFVVQSGLVEIRKQAPSGETVIGYVGAGEIFGEMAPIDLEPRMAGARAVQDTTCVVISEAVFRHKLGKADPFVRDLLHVLVRALRSVTGRLTDGTSR